MPRRLTASSGCLQKGASSESRFSMRSPQWVYESSKCHWAKVRGFLSTIRALCAIRPVDIETHEQALDLIERHRFSVYDGLIVAAAIRAGCRTLHSEDLHHGQRIE